MKVVETFNGLTAAEMERLDVLQEECAEVIMACAKIKRHGYQSHNPDEPPPATTNRRALETEFGHVLNALHMMRQAGDLCYTEVIYAQARKARTIGQWLHHQEDGK